MDEDLGIGVAFSRLRLHEVPYVLDGDVVLLPVGEEWQSCVRHEIFEPAEVLASFGSEGEADAFCDHVNGQGLVTCKAGPQVEAYQAGEI